MPEQAGSHFKSLAAGLPPEALAALGEALSSLSSARQSAGAEAAAAHSAALARLDAVWLSLAISLLERSGTALGPEQMLFLEGGVLGPELALRQPDGGPSQLDLLPREVCAELLETAGRPAEYACVLSLRQRIEALLRGELEPFDLDANPKVRARVYERRVAEEQARKPAGPQAPRQAEAGGAQREELYQRLKAARSSLEDHKARLEAAMRELLASVSSENMGALLSEVGELFWLCNDALNAEPSGEGREGALPEASLLLGGEVAVRAARSLAEVSRSRRECVQALFDLRLLQDAFGQELAQMRCTQSAPAVERPDVRFRAQPAPPALPLGPLPPKALSAVLKDLKATAALSEKSLQHSRRTGQRAGRILLREYFGKDGPGRGSFATAEAVGAALAKLAGLHRNLFPAGADGVFVIPPIVIEPGADLGLWLDDRFLLSYAHTQPAMAGAKLSLSPLEQSMALMFGSFLARGDIFNYRNERVRDNFIGEYAGEIEQKAVAKFVGAEKRLTFGTASTEKDSASREDAARDYLDFLFHLYNELPLPKRISPRRAGVLLKYVELDSPARRVRLALRLLARSEPDLCREVLSAAGANQPARLLEITTEALAADAQLAAKYREGALQALREVLGRSFVDSLEARSATAAPPATGKPAATAQSQPAQHNYFDL